MASRKEQGLSWVQDRMTQPVSTIENMLADAHPDTVMDVALAGLPMIVNALRPATKTSETAAAADSQAVTVAKTPVASPTAGADQDPATLAGTSRPSPALPMRAAPPKPSLRPSRFDRGGAVYQLLREEVSVEGGRVKTLGECTVGDFDAMIKTKVTAARRLIAEETKLVKYRKALIDSGAGTLSEASEDFLVKALL